MTWLGYSGTTGLDAVDYVLADHWVVPPAEEGLYTENAVAAARQPISASRRPTAVEPVAPLPALAKRRVTFGSFNNLNKVDRPRRWGSGGGCSMRCRARGWR